MMSILLKYHMAHHKVWGGLGIVKAFFVKKEKKIEVKFSYFRYIKMSIISEWGKVPMFYKWGTWDTTFNTWKWPLKFLPFIQGSQMCSPYLSFIWDGFHSLSRSFFLGWVLESIIVEYGCSFLPAYVSVVIITALSGDLACNRPPHANWLFSCWSVTPGNSKKHITHERVSVGRKESQGLWYIWLF